MWDISSTGHITARDTSLPTARRELQEELGITLPEDAFELLFDYLFECKINDNDNNQFTDEYLVTTLDPIPLEAFTLQETEVSAVKYIHWKDYKNFLANEDKEYVPYDVTGDYGQLFNIIDQRYKENKEDHNLSLQKQLCRYTPVCLDADLTGLSEADMEALALIIQASMVVDEIFYAQVWCSNPALRDWLKGRCDLSSLDELKRMYYSINKSPWSFLDENKAFLTTADSAVKLLAECGKPVSGWKALEYRAAFPVTKPPGANFYPPDMDKMEFELWKSSLNKEFQKTATGYFSVIIRHDEPNLERSLLKRLLKSKADTFLSNDYYESDIAWMELDSKLDVTIGPYETYEDALFGYKATFEAYIGIQDDVATQQLKLFGDNLQTLEQNLPLGNVYKSKDVPAAPIRVIQLICNAGVHSGLEEAKADIVGLWALKFLIDRDFLPKTLLKSMYVSFLAGCFRSIRFGLKAAHGKGQALQFNWLFEKGGFLMHADGTFSVDFAKVPVDTAPIFAAADKILESLK